MLSPLPETGYRYTLYGLCNIYHLREKLLKKSRHFKSNITEQLTELTKFQQQSLDVLYAWQSSYIYSARHPQDKNIPEYYEFIQVLFIL